MSLPRPTDRSLPLPILWVCLLSFGLAIPFLSLYSDDWPFIYVNHLAGFRGVVNFIQWVRPFGAWIFASVTTLFGEHIWLYHSGLLLLRGVDALLLLWLLRLIWPQHPRPALFAALLFAVYPAFKQQPLAVEYYPHFVVLGLLLLSFIIMVKAVQGQRLHRLLYLLSWILSFNLFFIEYFTGQELLRPFLLWIVLARPVSQVGQGAQDRLRHRVARLFALWAPYLLVDLLFLVWRVFILKFPSYQPVLVEQISRAGLAAGAGLLARIPGDLLRVGLSAWLQAFSVSGSLRAQGLELGVVLACFVPLLAYLLLYRPGQEENPSPTQRTSDLQVGLSYLGLGAAALFFAGWPFWITNIEISLDFPWNRATLAFILGASLFAAGLVQLLAAPRLYSSFTAHRIQAVILSLIVSFSCGLQLQNAIHYRNETVIFTPFFWQLAWRMPGLAPGTTLVMDENPFNYNVDKFYSPLVNWTLAPASASLETPFTVIDLYKAWGTLLPPSVGPAPIYRLYGTLTFHGSTDRLVLIHYQPPGCLRLLSQDMRGPLSLSKEARAMLRYSRPELALANPSSPSKPPAILGPEPPPTWCYYFEKADLAAQQDNWQVVASLADQATAQRLTPRDRSEWLVFIEGYARLGAWDKAQSLSRTLLGDRLLQSSVCQLWQGLGSDRQLIAASQSMAIKTYAALGCIE